MEAVKRSAPVPVFMENMTGMDGYYDDEISASPSAPA